MPSTFAAALADCSSGSERTALGSRKSTIKVVSRATKRSASLYGKYALCGYTMPFSGHIHQGMDDSSDYRLSGRCEIKENGKKEYKTSTVVKDQFTNPKPLVVVLRLPNVAKCRFKQTSKQASQCSTKAAMGEIPPFPLRTRATSKKMLCRYISRNSTEQKHTNNGN